MDNSNEDYKVVNFRYIYDNYFVLCEEFNEFELNKTNIRNLPIGKAFIKIPYWTDIHELHRLSSYRNPYNRNDFLIDDMKLKINKIKLLCIRIEDFEGFVYHMDGEFAKEMNPSLANFLLKNIDDVIDKHYSGGLAKEDGDKLAMDCYNYFGAINKLKYGVKNVFVPPAPAIVLLHRLCETLNCSFEEAVKMDKKIIDSVNIMLEQKNICQNPQLIGVGQRSR